MQHQITIREAVAHADIARFWEQLYRYYARDIFTEAGSGEREHFIGPEYYGHMMKIRSRPQDRAYFLFFVRDGQEIGFAMPVIFTSEDGKCFLMEYCIYPEYRGNGTGRACAGILLDWARARGARYAELNYGGDARRKRFWESVGFVPNGIDEWGDPLMLLPPEDPVPDHRGAIDQSRGLAAPKAGKRLPRGDRRSAAPKDAAGSAGPCDPRRQDHVLSGKTGIPGGRPVQRGTLLFHLCVLRHGRI